MGSEAKSAIPALTEALSDKNQSVKRAAVTALERIAEASGDSRPIELDETVTKPDTAEAAPIPAKMVKSLTKSLREEDPSVRLWSARLLGKSGSEAKTAIPALAAHCDDSDPHVQHAAAVALRSIIESLLGEAGIVVVEAKRIAEQVNAIPSNHRDEQREVIGDLLTQLTRIWPVEADTDSAFGIRGRKPTTGPDSADYFGYGGGGMWRVFEVAPNRPLLLKARGDQRPGSGNVCGDWRFTVSEEKDGSWVVKETINGPTDFYGERWYFYTPKTNRIRVDARAFFYLNVHQL
jgi:hypothetical protein